MTKRNTRDNETPYVCRFSRRRFIGTSTLTMVAALASSRVNLAWGMGRFSEPDPVDDGASWTYPQWLAIPQRVRQMLFQASEVFRAVRDGVTLPIEKMAPLPLVVALRPAPDQPVTTAFVVGHPNRIDGAAYVIAPPAWALGVIQVITDGPALDEITTTWSFPTPYGAPNVDGIKCWGTIVRDGSSFGLEGDNWAGSAVWFHEYAHSVTPRGPSLPEGWSDWDMTLRFPADNTPLIALSYLEQLVLNSPGDAFEALRTFLVIRERKRSLSPEYVTCTESRETREGIATYVEARFLAYTGHTATSPKTGKPWVYPPEIPEDTSWWKNYFAGEIAYAGSAILFALDRYHGAAWKPYYCAHGNGIPGLSFPELVRHYIEQPQGDEAQRLFEHAASQHDLRDLERRISEADLPNQDLNPRP
jgi:hypothetical protein